MPFKLRLKKTRQYNVLSRNVLVISVELLDKTTLECTLSADSTGQDCLHNVCQRLSLHQPEFLGLRYMSKKPYPKVRWVELDRPLKKQLDKYAQSPALALAVLYYIHDVSLLQDDVTRSHYFLQVKQDVLEGKLRCNHEQAVLLASYSLQAEFGDHQPDRHTAEYLKDFKLFPKQIGNEGEVGALLEAVVWQYSSLQGLAQALAETYYILEAQRLDGYGQETFMARDERGSEVYLGTSLMGIDVRPAAGHTHVFYRWNDITNLVNNKRNFGIECQRTDETVHFTFDEPDAAKYVWKMCVKQHTFYKRNQEVLEGGTGSETRSLAIPDLQSSVMSTTATSTQLHHLTASHDMLEGRGGLGEVTLRSSADQQALASYSTTLPQYELSYIHQSAESTGGHLGPGVESSGSQLMSDPAYGMLSQSAYSLNTSHHPQQTQVVLAPHGQVSQQQQQQSAQQQAPPQQATPSQQQKHQAQHSQHQHEAASQQIALYSSNLSLPSTRGSSFLCPPLPPQASVGESQRFYICCQGPLANTVSHFWQCVWEADVYLVVMLTSVVGDTATSKSFPYWPQTDNTSVECSQFRVFRKHSTVSGSHITSRLQVVHAPSRRSRTIWHLQYTDWADHGCPEDLLGFINFLEELSTLRRYTYKEVRGVGRNRNTPVLVHCSAGVGRSGVTILCDLLLEATDHNLPLDPPKVLQHLRQQRMALVQTIAQYRLVYQVLLAYLNRARLI